MAVRLKLYCWTMERWVDVVKKECTLAMGAGDGTLTAGCPYKKSRTCPLEAQAAK